MQEMLHQLNELHNARRARFEAAAGHIPSLVWWVIGFLGLLIVGFTALLGMTSLWVHFVLLAGFTTAIVLGTIRNFVRGGAVEPIRSWPV
jgi:uncharacterized protein (DUF983 family)